MTADDKAYYRSRAEAELARAEVAANTPAMRAHVALAERYMKLADEDAATFGSSGRTAGTSPWGRSRSTLGEEQADAARDEDRMDHMRLSSRPAMPFFRN